MRPSTFTPISTTTQTCPDASTIRTFKAPVGTSALLISVETTNARLTLDGTDPTAGTGSHVIPTGQVILLLVGSGLVIKAVSTAGTNAVVGITWLQ